MDDDPKRVEFDPPRKIQVRGYLGDWLDAIQHAWKWDRSRRSWRAIITVEVDASEVRQWRGGAAAHRPDGHKRAARQPQQKPPYSD